MKISAFGHAWVLRWRWMLAVLAIAAGDLTEHTVLVRWASSAARGSSMSSSRGRAASARAIATRCCWPPESWSARIYALSRMPTLSSDSSALSLSSLRNAPSSTRQKGISGTQAESTFLITVVRVTRLNDWNTMPTSARRLASSLPSCGNGLPSMRISPESMVSNRLMVRHIVDLPEPDGPTMTSTSPLRTVRLMSLSTCRSP